jgi:hypothetical protein
MEVLVGQLPAAAVLIVSSLVFSGISAILKLDGGTYRQAQA